MLISLVLMGGVMALAAQLALGQLRHFQGIGVLIGLRGQIGHATTIVARALWGVSPIAGDIVIALDSAIEFHATLGSAVACEGPPGTVMIPQPRDESGNTLSGFWDAPASGDRMHAFLDDSLGAGWVTFHVAEPPEPGPACTTFGDLSPSWLIALREPITIPAGSTLRFTRPVRLSLYKALDGRWYLGAKDWSGDVGDFSSIQPIAGPLRPYSQGSGESGLRLRYHDATGVEMLPVADPSRIASITITSRAESDAPLKVAGLVTAASGRYVDSIGTTIALRNAQ